MIVGSYGCATGVAASLDRRILPPTHEFQTALAPCESPCAVAAEVLFGGGKAVKDGFDP